MILNLTQHPASPEQVKAGVFDLPEGHREQLQRLLTFDELPTQGELVERAMSIVDLIDYADWHPVDPDGESPHFTSAMIGGAPFFMPVLANELAGADIQALYAFSRRESVEEPLPDGTVRKTAVFRHLGFVPHSV